MLISLYNHSTNLNLGFIFNKWHVEWEKSELENSIHRIMRGPLM